MNIENIENNLKTTIENFSKETFVYDLLLAYDTPKSIVTKLKLGKLNMSKAETDVLWKKKLYFKVLYDIDLHLAIDDIKNDAKAIAHNPRFIIVTDFQTILSIDTKTRDSLDINFLDLPKHFDFFLPLAGLEKAQLKFENPADVKAAEKMAKLYDEIKKDNPTDTTNEVHGLNVFLSRLLFCFFAEDTEIFKHKQFVGGVKSHTQKDGSDLKSYLERLFDVLNQDYPKRKNLPVFLESFPYVNGGLFKDTHEIPIFTYKSRLAIIECGELNWKDINPDIFGSMIQAVITPEHRGGFGMHYTSVPNIMKIIEPLFLTELISEFDKDKNNPQKLNSLLFRLSKLKFFDPACGSGNFLIIAYKELRLLEIKIIQRLEVLQYAASGFEDKQLALIPKAQQNLAAMYQRQLFSNIQLNQFYGIELDDFAHEIAILSLWLAQHQMNMMFKEVLGQGNPTLPLKDGGQITHGNAIRLDWRQICPIKPGDEIYVLGNPPYKGARNQDELQKNDMAIVFHNREVYKDSDYVLGWFIKGSEFIANENAKFAFVTTSSIAQGSQIAYFWPDILQRNQEIGFAYQPFKWGNNAKDKAGVICVIIGVQNEQKEFKSLFTSSIKKLVENITPYLTEGKTIIVKETKKPISNLPLMVMGNMARDGGNLILNEDEKNKICIQYPGSERLFKKFLGAEEYINGKIRFCLWIEDIDLEYANSIPEISKRISEVFNFRTASKAKTTNQYSKISHKLAQRSHQIGSSIIVPRVSSERREYIPFGFLDEDTVISDSAQAIYNASPYLLGILLSKIHNVWVKKVGGYLGTSIRYSTTVCYNTFPFPDINKSQKQDIEVHVYRILEVRESFSEKTLAQLYDPDKMPGSLREAHNLLDLAIERCYRSKLFKNDDSRLEYLFKMYEQILNDQKSRGTLFEIGKKVKKVKIK